MSRHLLKSGLRINHKYQLFFGKNDPNNQVFQVRAIVDKELVVTRHWTKDYGWLYAIEGDFRYQLYRDQGHLKEVTSQAKGDYPCHVIRSQPSP